MCVIEDARHEREGERREDPRAPPEDSRAEDVDQPEQEPTHDHRGEAEGHGVGRVEVVLLVGEPGEGEERLDERRVLVVVGPARLDRLRR